MSWVGWTMEAAITRMTAFCTTMMIAQSFHSCTAAAAAVVVVVQLQGTSTMQLTMDAAAQADSA
jgi:hypothetical protein